MTSVAEAKQEEIPDSHFGGCPQCGKSDCVRNIGRDHWFCCDEHKTKWCVGSNLFSNWRHENEEDWRENSALISSYTVVRPIRSWPPKSASHGGQSDQATPETEERVLNVQLQGALAYEDGFEEPILNLIAGAFSSESIFLKRAAVAAMDAVGLIADTPASLFAAVVGRKRICLVSGVGEDDARVVLAKALFERKQHISGGSTNIALDADDFELQEPTDEERRKWHAAYTVPPRAAYPICDEYSGVPFRMPPTSLFLAPLPADDVLPF